jgi:3-deoxy-D-manno-octulosonic-acid transferase
MIRWIYNILAQTIDAAMNLASWVFPNTKVSRMIIGRKTSLINIQNLDSALPKIWFHAASLGEFEMALPLIQTLNQEYHCCITFFSPSGYENAKMPLNCSKYYIQNDSPKKVAQWLLHLNPQAVIFVKYEFWINHLRALNQNNISFFYWNILLRRTHFLGSFWGREWRSELKNCKKFYAQNLQTSQLLNEWLSPNIHIETIGDARYLRAAQLRDSASEIPQAIIDFCQNSDVVILGSCWDEEVEVLRETLLKLEFPKSFRYIVAPHDLSETRIQKIQKTLSNSDNHVFRFSEITEPSAVNVHRKEKIEIGILDSMGWLSRVYHWCDLALVGGAFGGGLHNIIEAQAAGCFVLFGPKTEKFPEAQQSVYKGVALQGGSISELTEKLISVMARSDFHELRGQVNEYFNGNITAISQVKNEITAHILTN